MRRSALSITQRLTLTSILLTGAVLVPALVLLEVAAKHSIETDAIAFATETAQRAAESVLGQWDEEFLVEFRAESAPFRDLKVGLQDWCLSRPNGTVEHAGGEFLRGVAPLSDAASGLSVGTGRKALRLASVPLINSRVIAFEDAGKSVQEAIRLSGPPEQCLSIRRETAGGGVAYEVKLLTGSVIQAVKITPEGAVVHKSKEALPPALPQDLLGILTARGEAVSHDVRGWRHHDGHLLAVTAIAAPGAPPAEVGVNRIGERFRLGPGPNDVTPDLDSRVHLTVAVDATTELRTVQSLTAGLWIGGGLVWGLLSLAGWYVARRAMRPVQRIVDAAAQIGVERLDARLPVGKVEDELSRIAATINGMLDRLEAGYRREQQFTSDASHELRTPLAKIMGEIDLALARARDAPEYRETLERCRCYAAGLERLVESLLLLGRLESGPSLLEKSPVDLGTAAAETISHLPPEDRPRVALTLGESRGPLLALGEKSLLQILLRNLIENALRYSQADAPVRVEVALDGPGRLRLQVEDRGPGIPESARERVFDRFHRLDGSRSRNSGGLGLGLAIVKAIARAHEGDVELLAAEGGGTVVRASFPAA